MPRIHPAAIVSPRAEIADDAEIGPFCIVADRVRIGAGTVLSSFVTLLDFVEILSLLVLVPLGEKP